MRRIRPVHLVLAFQLAVLAVIPFRAIQARVDGIEVTLRTRPVDPYDVLSGYYVTLAYEVETTDAPSGPPARNAPDEAWITVERGEPAWSLAGVEQSRPQPDPDRVSLKARRVHGRYRLAGLDRFYIAETERGAVDQAMADAGGRALVHLRVDADGNVALMSLDIGGRTWGAAAGASSRP